MKSIFRVFSLLVLVSVGLQPSIGQWVRTNGLIDTMVTSLAVSENGGSTETFAGAWGAGISLSTDNGENWMPANGGLASTYISSLVATGVLEFAGTWGAGIYRSTDNGTNWDNVNSLFGGFVACLAVSPFGGGTSVFAGYSGQGVALSTDNGASWTAVDSGLTNTGITCLAVASGGGGVNLFAGTWGGVFLSTDNGTSWTSAGLPNEYISSLAVIGTNLFASDDGDGVFLTTDNGTSWTSVNSGLQGYVNVLLASRGSVLAGTDGDGIYYSSDDGSHWYDVSLGIGRYAEVFSLTTSSQFVFAGTDDGVWRRPLSELVLFTIDASADVGGGISPSGTVLVESGGIQQFTIGPNPGYRVDSLIVDGVKVDSTTSYTFTNVAASHTIRATFVRFPYSPWTYTNTGMNHTILIDTSVHPLVNGVPLDSGDFIGVFYTSDAGIQCGGYEMWTGAGAIAVSAFGNELSPPDKNGFANDEVFQWKIYRWHEQEIYDAVATYVQPDLANHLTRTNTYATDGISRIALLFGGGQTASYSLRQGWSIISTYLNPASNILDTILGPVKSDVIIMKNGNGKSYIPWVPINSIGTWNMMEGYQLKMDTDRTLSVPGTRIVPELTPIPVRSGWSIIPYFRQSAMGIDTALAGLGSALVIAKDQDGNAYIPSIPVNGIGDMQPGQGYQVKLSAADTLVYPMNSFVFPKRPVGAQHIAAAAVKPHYQVKVKTDNNATVVFPKKAVAEILMKGDEIGIFDEKGVLVGSGMYEGDNLAIAAWGDDATTVEKDGLIAGERYSVRFWYTKSSSEHVAKQIEWSEGGSTYEVNGINVVEKVHVDLADLPIPDHVQLYQNYPNPFNPTTTIRFSLPKGMDVRIRIYNVLGEAVAEVASGYYGTGYHEIAFSPSAYPSGVYYCRIEAGGSSEVQKMVLMK